MTSRKKGRNYKSIKVWAKAMEEEEEAAKKYVVDSSIRIRRDRNLWNRKVTAPPESDARRGLEKILKRHGHVREESLLPPQVPTWTHFIKDAVNARTFNSGWRVVCVLAKLLCLPDFVVEEVVAAMIYTARLESKKKRSSHSFSVLIFVTICLTNRVTKLDAWNVIWSEPREPFRREVWS